jgi:hypothetical protein
MVKWVEALKEWNAKHNGGRWCVPKKGTTEYDAVMRIVKGEKHEEPKEPEAPKKKFQFKRPAKKAEEPKEEPKPVPKMIKASEAARKMAEPRPIIKRHSSEDMKGVAKLINEIEKMIEKK